MAATTIQEFLNADVPGSRNIELRLYKTKYGRVLRQLLPERRTPRSQVDAFEESLVGSLRNGYDLPVKGPAQARHIVRHAPRYVVGLRMSDASRQSIGETIHGVVTTAGHMVSVRGRVDIYNNATYYLPTKVDKLHERGGMAPGVRVAQDIRDRVVELRTSGTKR